MVEPSQRYKILLEYVHGKSIKEIGELFSLSRQRVYYIIFRGGRKKRKLNT